MYVLIVPISPLLSSTNYSRLMAFCLLDIAFCIPNKLCVHKRSPQSLFPQPAVSQFLHLGKRYYYLPSHTIKNLCVFLDSILSFKFHIKSFKKFRRILLNIVLLFVTHISGSQT